MDRAATVTRVYLLCQYSKGRDRIHEVIGVFDTQRRAEQVMRSAFPGKSLVDIEVRYINRWYTGDALSDKQDAAHNREMYRAARA